jgi:hypothetical protein
MAKQTSKQDLTLRIPSKRVTLEQLHRVLGTWYSLLAEVGSAVANVRRDAIDYVITKAKVGSMTLSVEPCPRQPGAVPKRSLPRIQKVVATGLTLLAKRSQRPKFFSDAALEKVKELSEQLDEKMPDLHLVKGNKIHVAITQQMSKHVQQILGPQFESIGSVEGVLEGLIIHGRSRFLLYDHLTGRQVTCFFSDRIPWKEIIEAFGKRTIASGLVKARKTGEKLSIEVTRLRVVPPEEELPKPDEVLGILRNHG